VRGGWHDLPPLECQAGVSLRHPQAGALTEPAHVAALVFRAGVDPVPAARMAEGRQRIRTRE